MPFQNSKTLNSMSIWRKNTIDILQPCSHYCTASYAFSSRVTGTLGFQKVSSHKKGKAAFSFVVTVLLWRKGCISAKGSCRLQEKLYKLNNSIPLFTLLYCQLCSCSSRVTGTLVNSRKLVPRVNCISISCLGFQIIIH